MHKKRQLKANFYRHKSGRIFFKQVIKGEFIHGPTGTSDAREVNRNAKEIRQRIINQHFGLQKEEENQKSLHYLRLEWLKTKKHLRSSTYNAYNANTLYYLKKGFPNASISRVNAIRRDWNIFMRWCIKRGYDVELLDGDTDSEGRMRVFSDDELKKIFSVVVPKDLNDCFRFGYYTGARRNEFAAPNNDNLRSNNGLYYLEVVKKGGRKRIIRINKQALGILKGRNWEFWAYTPLHLTKYFKKFARKAGVGDAKLHDLRRTFGYNLLMKGTDIYTVSKLLGHSSVKVTEKHYLPLLPVKIEDFVL